MDIFAYAKIERLFMSAKETLYQEKQKFTKWWLWIIFLGADFIFLSGTYMQVVLGRPFGNEPISNTSLIIITGLLVLITLVFITNRLDTLIKKDGMYVRFFPFQWKFRYYSWETIKECRYTRYKTSASIAGVGLRFGFFSNQMAYNISGKEGIHLILEEQKPIFIGTKNPKKMAAIIAKLGHLNLK